MDRPPVPVNDPGERELILAYVASHHTLTLATSHDGVPWAAGLFYANEGLTLYFLSEPATRHAQYLAENPRVAITIQEDPPAWTEIRGVQMEGTCFQVTDPLETAHILAVYGTRFPFIQDLLHAPREIGSAFARARFYKVIPSWARLTDNTRGFGWKGAVVLQDPPPKTSGPEKQK